MTGTSNSGTVFRVAAVSFLNMVPLIEYLGSSASESVEIVRDMPSRLGALLTSGEADVAILPVVEVFRGLGGGIVPGVAIACRGPVDSVKLFLRVPPQDVRTVLADRGSKTSVALAGILLDELYGVRPRFETVEPVPGMLGGEAEAVLVIGDRCFRFEQELRERGDRNWTGLDLGEAWVNSTGLPFVFAVWALSPDLEARVGAQQVAKLVAMLTAARDRGVDDLAALATREAAAGRLGRAGEATSEAIAYYFCKSLCFYLDDAALAGMRLFHAKCIEHGVVPAGPSPLVL